MQPRAAIPMTCEPWLPRYGKEAVANYLGTTSGKGGRMTELPDAGRMTQIPVSTLPIPRVFECLGGGILCSAS